MYADLAAKLEAAHKALVEEKTSRQVANQDFTLLRNPMLL
jgi:hypothetical protein